MGDVNARFVIISIDKRRRPLNFTIGPDIFRTPPPTTRSPSGQNKLFYRLRNYIYYLIYYPEAKSCEYWSSGSLRCKPYTIISYEQRSILSWSWVGWGGGRIISDGNKFALETRLGKYIISLIKCRHTSFCKIHFFFNVNKRNFLNFMFGSIHFLRISILSRFIYLINVFVLLINVLFVV